MFYFLFFPVIRVLDWNSVIKFWLVYSSGPLVWLTGLDQSPTGIFAWERKKERKKSNNYLSFCLFVPSNFHLLPNKRHLLLFSECTQFCSSYQVCWYIHYTVRVRSLTKFKVNWFWLLWMCFPSLFSRLGILQQCRERQIKGI